MGSWWDSVDSLQTFVTRWRWVLVITPILSAIFAVVTTIAKTRLKRLKKRKDIFVDIDANLEGKDKKTSWWESVDSVDHFETRMTQLTAGLAWLSVLFIVINTSATNKLDVLKSQKQTLLLENARKESESLRLSLAENIQTQSEIGRLENLVTQIRLLRKRSDLGKLVEVKNTSKNEFVLQWVKERLTSLASDYEMFEKQNFESSSCRTALECVYGDKLPEMKKKSNFIQLIINDLRSSQDLNEITGIFLALSEATGHPFSNFDFDGVEDWCAVHGAICKASKKR